MGEATVQITAPNLQVAEFEIHGIAPLVIHRFSTKTIGELLGKQLEGKSAGSKKKREPQSELETFNNARYQSREGWDGFHAAAIRCAMIRACSLVNFKMTLAKMSIFVVADGWDSKEPQIPLVRIHGEATLQKDVARVDNGNPYVTIRAAYHSWSAQPRIRFDADQFTLSDVTNLLMRVGMQVGICEGRPSSTNSAGMGWGLFEIAKQKAVAA